MTPRNVLRWPPLSIHKPEIWYLGVLHRLQHWGQKIELALSGQGIVHYWMCVGWVEDISITSTNGGGGFFPIIMAPKRR
jgi:hypothetical protein